jgi:hypothetical protein
MKYLLPYLSELTKGVLAALQAADDVLAPLEERHEERGSIEGGLARLHIRRAMPPLLRMLVRLAAFTGASADDTKAH